jgi:hypothetical protein
MERNDLSALIGVHRRLELQFRCRSTFVDFLEAPDADRVSAADGLLVGEGVTAGGGVDHQLEEPALSRSTALGRPSLL